MNRLRLVTIVSAMALICFFTETSQARSALLVTHYGSSDDVTRSETIDKITADMQAAFPELTVREAYISPVVRRNLKRNGIETDSPTEALLRLRVERFDTVYVQSTTIIDGSEMAEVRKSVAETAPFFSCIKVGNSLLHTPDDCMKLVEILSDYPCAEDEAIVYVGHGNNLPSTAIYTQLDYMFSDMGLKNFHVSTIEGYPTAQSTLHEISEGGNIKQVNLIPLLLVCGNHTKNDIAGEFADVLKSKGYNVQTILRGLAEIPAVRALYIAKARILVENCD